MRSRPLLPLLFLLFLCCRGEETPAPEESPSFVASAPEMAPAPPVPSPAAVVNEEEISEDAVRRVIRRAGWPRSKALQVMVDATLVIGEADRQGQRCATSGEPETCAKELLAALYSPETLCKHIREQEIDQAYQELFDKDWPVEAYAGWVAGIRCCGGEWGACDTAAAAGCRQGLPRWGPPFESLALSWAAGTPVEDAVSRIFPGEALHVSDFFFTYWPESGPEGQPKLESWDPEMLAEVVALPVGEVSRPLASPMGLHVFRLDRYKPARLKDDPEVREQIRVQLCRGRVVRVQDAYVRELRGAAVIRIP